MDPFKGCRAHSRGSYLDPIRNPLTFAMVMILTVTTIAHLQRTRLIMAASSKHKNNDSDNHNDIESCNTRSNDHVFENHGDSDPDPLSFQE